MKNTQRYAAILLLFVVIFASCKKKKEKDTEETYVCTTCSQAPQGAAANDNSSKGIYKGVVIGSSGTIKFDIANASSNAITAVLVIDGVTVNLTTTYTWVAGGISTAPFTGTLNGQPVTINFSVGATGSGATVLSATIPGHPNAVFSLVKETSTTLARCYEGTFTTSANEKGTFNIIVSTLLKGWTGKSRKDGSSTTTDISGSYVNDKLYWGSGTNTEIATMTNDTFAGTFNDGSSNVTVKGKRTL
ncbi:hypothetical protein [Pedobacter sp. UBA4863]|uniref:hypothetical protein n=1 Tax=Pedobacter sp. UBA4863 TaxID=1947060 RepID=UPI0025F48AE2|nr:hypothetical protein [Pedobacter sp. UBA4863]